MRSIFILAIFGTLLLTGVSFAETDAECKTRCSTEKASNDQNCSQAEESFDKTRARCFQDNQDTYNKCVKDCQQPEPTPQPEPTDTPSVPEET
jgi:hypothetical protein